MTGGSGVSAAVSGTGVFSLCLRQLAANTSKAASKKAALIAFLLLATVLIY